MYISSEGCVGRAHAQGDVGGWMVGGQKGAREIWRETRGGTIYKKKERERESSGTATAAEV